MSYFERYFAALDGPEPYTSLDLVSDDVQFAIENVIPMRRAQVRYLRSIGPPAEGTEQFEKLLVAMEEGIARAKRDPHSMLEAEEHFAFSRAFDIGLEFGLEKCWLA